MRKRGSLRWPTPKGTRMALTELKRNTKGGEEDGERELVLKIPIAYRARYKDGVAAEASMLQLEADMN